MNQVSLDLIPLSVPSCATTGRGESHLSDWLFGVSQSLKIHTLMHAMPQQLQDFNLRSSYSSENTLRGALCKVEVVITWLTHGKPSDLMHHRRLECAFFFFFFFFVLPASVIGGC